MSAVYIYFKIDEKEYCQWRSSSATNQMIYNDFDFILFKIIEFIRGIYRS
jgi:hypothetical protein